MQPVLEYIAQVGIQTAITAVLIYFLAPALFGQLLKRDLQRHQADLDRHLEAFKIHAQAEYGAKLDSARHEMTLRAHEHAVRFTRLHERRAEVIAELASRVESLHSAVQYFANEVGVVHRNRGASWERALKAYKRLRTYHRIRSIWLDPDTSAAVGKLLELLYGPITDLQLVEERSPDDFAAAWRSAQRVVNEEAPKARQHLERRFRTILAGEDRAIPAAATDA